MTGATEQKKPFHRGGFKDGKEKQQQSSENDSPMLKMFREYSKELDTKHDKYERIVKLSRDITIVSKRIIFSIHALMRSKNVDSDVQKINGSLITLRDTQFKAIAKELVNEDPYQFIKAYMWGIQEFVEALTFFHYVREGRYCGYEEVIQFLEVKDESEDSGGDSLKLLIPIMEYVLGVEDLTGELMRHCIDSIAASKPAEGKAACTFGQRLYAAFLLLTPYGCGEYHKKVGIAKQSVEKMEYACYTRHIRGSEFPDEGTSLKIFD